MEQALETNLPQSYCGHLDGGASAREKLSENEQNVCVKVHLIKRILRKLLSTSDFIVATAVGSTACDGSSSEWHEASQDAFWTFIKSGRALVIPNYVYWKVYQAVVTNYDRNRPRCVRQFIIQRMLADFVFTLSTLQFTAGLSSKFQTQTVIYIPWSFVYHSDLVISDQTGGSSRLCRWPSAQVSAEQAFYSLVTLSGGTLRFACYYLLPQLEDFMENREYTVFFAHDEASATRLMHSPLLPITCGCKNLRQFGAFVPANQLTSSFTQSASSNESTLLLHNGLTLGNILLQLPLLTDLVYDVCPVVVRESDRKSSKRRLVWDRDVSMADVKTVSSVRDIVDSITIESLSAHWPVDGRVFPHYHASLQYLTMGVNVRQLSGENDNLNQFCMYARQRMPALKWLDSAEQEDHVLCSLMLPRLPLSPAPRCFIFNALLEYDAARNAIVDNVHAAADGFEWLKMFDPENRDVDQFVRFLRALRHMGDLCIDRHLMEARNLEFDPRLRSNCFHRKCFQLTLCGSYVTRSAATNRNIEGNDLIMPTLEALCNTALGDGWNLHLTILIDFLLSSAFRSHWLNALTECCNASNVTRLTIEHRDFFDNGLHLPESCVVGLLLRLPRLRRLRLRGVTQITGFDAVTGEEVSLTGDKLRKLAEAFTVRGGKRRLRDDDESDRPRNECDILAVKYCDLTIEAEGALFRELRDLVSTLNEWSPDDVRAPFRVVCSDEGCSSFPMW